MYVSVVFVIRCLYSAVREQCFIRIIYYYYYGQFPHRRIVEVLRSPKAVELQVASGCRSPGRRGVVLSKLPQSVCIQVTAQAVSYTHLTLPTRAVV